ncbi:MAG: hypothetical protein GOV15_03845 [Candidatus Diapherotrites archaeon]|nr:hypothetical protein [Candidatus Diapherotrites archaeon]
MGYSKQQIKELQQTINKTPADLIIIGTPIHLQKILKLNKPSVNVTYELKERGQKRLENLVKKTLGMRK